VLGKGLALPCWHLLPGANIPHTGLVVTACKVAWESSAIEVPGAMWLLLNVYQAGLMSLLMGVSCLEVQQLYTSCANSMPLSK